MLLKTSEIYVALYDFHLLPHVAEVAKISITKVVAKAVPDGKVGDEDQHKLESLRENIPSSLETEMTWWWAWSPGPTGGTPGTWSQHSPRFCSTAES